MQKEIVEGYAPEGEIVDWVHLRVTGNGDMPTIFIVGGPRFYRFQQL